MKKNYALLIALFLAPFLGFSQSYFDGIFVLNEGNMGSNSASLSFIDENYQRAAIHQAIPCSRKLIPD